MMVQPNSPHYAQQARQDAILTALRAEMHLAQLVKIETHNARKHGHYMCTCGCTLSRFYSEDK